LISTDTDSMEAAGPLGPTRASRTLRWVRRATLLSAIALFLFPVSLFVKAQEAVVGIVAGAVLAAAAHGILLADSVRMALTAKIFRPVIFGGLASAIVIALPGLPAALSGESSLLVNLLPGAIFISVHVMLLGVFLCARRRNVSLLFLSLLSLAGSAGPFLLLLPRLLPHGFPWFLGGTLGFFLLALLAAACDLVLAYRMGAMAETGSSFDSDFFAHG